MPSPRLLAPWTEDQPDRSAIYHVVSRVVDRRFLLGSDEKACLNRTDNILYFLLHKFTQSA